jgi:hypothetical protein
LAEKYSLLPLALGVSIALPVVMVALFRAWSGRIDEGPAGQPDSDQ